jgi:toxin HigB-1
VQQFFAKGSKAGIVAAHASKLGRLLTALDAATLPQQMNKPGWRLHSLEGQEAARWSVWVNGNWRLTFEFDDGDAILVDYEDYH